MKKAYFAGGCFWCIANAFTNLNGIINVIEGYAGGDKINPTYQEVKSQVTNHRETICIEYNEKIISYKELVDILFDNIDPFDSEGQFIDRGFSYTLAVFYLNELEKEICKNKIEKVEKQNNKKVYVSLIPYSNFFEAEEEHHNYALKNPEAFEKEIKDSGRLEYFKN